MKKIFEQGHFRFYRGSACLDESRSSIIRHSEYSLQKTTVFISHKHEDLEDLKGIVGYFQKFCNVNVYIDSQDPSMPRVTSAETAHNIKKRIEQCDKFILLATNGAIESKWCNWELGYGDAHKFKDHIALLPLKPKNTLDKEYKGNEYMSIYPYIACYDGTEKDKDGNFIRSGYYVCTKGNDKTTIISLQEWFKRK